jgi:hypothetical protein
MASEAFDRGILKVIVATCSLAAGINLPARRVIINGARMGREMIGLAMHRQMRGRAGRKGKDEIGETYLCCQKADLEALADPNYPPVESCLTPEERCKQSAPGGYHYQSCKQPRGNPRIHTAVPAVSDDGTYSGIGNGGRRHR